MKTAIVIGATGATGRYLVEYLLNEPSYQNLKVFSRRPTGIEHPKLDEHIVNFDACETWQNKVTGDDLFSALGTTIKQAGSKEAQYRVDFSYQASVIEAARQNGVGRLLLVSSPGADARSRMFYSRIKGELDDFAVQQGFASTAIFQPSVIEADRPDNRRAEKAAAWLLGKLTGQRGPMARWRPIQAKQLAQAMVRCATASSPLAQGTHYYVLDEIFELID